MAYSKQNFQNGQILNATNLEKMENGIIAGQGAHNLLDNSNFRDPVNSRGKNTYSDAGNEYTIDRWKTQSGTNISIENGYINIIGQGELYQIIQNPKDGIYTFAARVLINSVGQFTPIMGVNNGGNTGRQINLDADIGEWKTYILQYDLSSMTAETIKFLLSPRGGDTTASISVEWAAMYKGTYAANTLPAYVPKGRHVEMLNCGVSLQPHNLLDNSDFRDPVNSRGITNTEASGYHIDKWKKENESGKVTVGNGYLSMTGTGAYWFLTQYIEPKKIKSGAVYTIALADTSGSISICSTVMSTNMTKFTARHTFTSGAVVATNVEYTSDKYSIYFTSNSSKETRFAWAALYEGAYTINTLPAYVSKGKHVEMLNCGVPLTPPNMLINSDFSNPVAQAGLNRTYNQTKYLCDRWVGYQNMEAEQQPNGIKLTTTVPYSRILQYVNLQVGKAYTLAFCASNISSQHRIAICNEDLSETVQIKTGSDEILVINFIAEYNTMAILYYPGYSDNGGSSLLKWAALYEGTYITEALPSYIPKGIHTEKLDCGIPLAPHNLLNNSDFCNPVNQGGMTSYGGQCQTIDKWYISGTGSRASLTTLGIQLEGATFTQTVSLSLGTYTFAVYLSDKTTLFIQFTYNGSSAITVLGGTSETTGANIRVSNYNTGFINVQFVQTDDSVTHTLVWAALYKGVYNASTLPPYVPKGKHIEMLNCGIPFPPYNLLDNSDFTDAVNSHEVKEVTNSSTYFIDRWTADFANGTQKVNVNKSGMTLNNFYAGVKLSVQQEVKNLKDGAYTAAASADGSIFLCQFKIIAGNYSKILNINNGNGQININYTNSTLTFRLQASANNTLIFKWAALYEGIYDVDTIPIYQSKGKHVEMLNCGIPLQPHNLLDNSDFRIKNNIINTKGLTDYSFDSGDVFDRWRLHWTGDGRVSIKDGYIELYRKTNSTYLFQHPKDLESMIGKTYTVAAKVRYNGYIGWIDSTQRVNSGLLALNDWDIATCTFTVGSATSDIGKAGIEIATKADLSFEVQWIALYEGAYTKETLPAYVPNGKHVEMLNCNISLAPHNLLDNSDFRNPVNQRGQTSYTNNGHTIDRWKDTSNATTIITESGLTLQNDSTSDNAYWRQRVPAKILTSGKTYTMAIKIKNNIFCGTAIIDTSNSVTFYDANGLYLSCSGLTSSSYWTIQIAVSPKRSFSGVSWAALYEGSYTASTLPAYQPKGYAAELAECQRYFERIGSAESVTLGNAVYVGSGAKAFVFSIKYAPKRLKSPSVTFSDVSNYRVLFQDAVNASTYGASGVTAIDDIMAENPYARFRVSVSSAIDTNSWATLQRQDGAQNAYIDISADL